MQSSAIVELLAEWTSPGPAHSAAEKPGVSTAAAAGIDQAAAGALEGPDTSRHSVRRTTLGANDARVLTPCRRDGLLALRTTPLIMTLVDVTHLRAPRARRQDPHLGTMGTSILRSRVQDAKTGLAGQTGQDRVIRRRLTGFILGIGGTVTAMTTDDCLISLVQLGHPSNSFISNCLSSVGVSIGMKDLGESPIGVMDFAGRGRGRHVQHVERVSTHVGTVIQTGSRGRRP
jgi:hypothetical protein